MYLRTDFLIGQPVPFEQSLHQSLLQDLLHHPWIPDQNDEDDPGPGCNAKNYWQRTPADGSNSVQLIMRKGKGLKIVM